MHYERPLHCWHKINNSYNCGSVTLGLNCFHIQRATYGKTAAQSGQVHANV